MSKKTKKTKVALLTSIMSIVLCCAMLVGTTFAWFTDEASTAVNTIQAGTLDVAIVDENGNSLEGKTISFKDVNNNNDILWEPGVTYVTDPFVIKNNGNLALKYMIAISGIDGSAKLLDAIDFYIVKADSASSIMSGSKFDKDSADNLDEAGKEYYLSPKGEKMIIHNSERGDSSSQFCLVGHMDEDADNQYQGLSLGGIGITVFATQVEAEFDSFTNDYDKDADTVQVYTSGTHEINEKLYATSATDVITAIGEDTVVNIRGGYYDAGEQECAVWAKEGATVNIYGGEFIHTGNPDESEATSAHHFDMIYAGGGSNTIEEGGKINIYGGFFSARNPGVWLLNEKDNVGEIKVYGGIFVNWDPANNVSEGANTNFLAEGYISVPKVQENGDIWYYVLPSDSKFVDDIESLKTTILSAANGDTICIEAGLYTITDQLTINGISLSVIGLGDVTIELNVNSENSGKVFYIYGSSVENNNGIDVKLSNINISYADKKSKSDIWVRTNSNTCRGDVNLTLDNVTLSTLIVDNNYSANTVVNVDLKKTTVNEKITLDASPFNNNNINTFTNLTYDSDSNIKSIMIQNAITDDGMKHITINGYTVTERGEQLK